MELWRPDWTRLMGEQNHPDAEELVTVTKETARLSLSALNAQNEQDAYHNYMAAAEELRHVVGQG